MRYFTDGGTQMYKGFTALKDKMDAREKSPLVARGNRCDPKLVGLGQNLIRRTRSKNSMATADHQRPTYLIGFLVR